MLLRIHPETPSPRLIRQAAETLRQGGLVIYPTDTVYGLGCDITQSRAVEAVARLRGLDVKKEHFSFICHDMSHLSDFAQVDTATYKLMRRYLPGPYTFILPATSLVPKMFKSRRKTVGIRIPDNTIIREIVRELGNPIMSTSIYDEDEILEYTTDPELIYEKWGEQVDLIIDGGFGGNVPSTVIDCTSDQLEVIRLGKGEWEE